MKEYKCVATTPDETKAVLAAELKRLGAEEIVENFRAVNFSCDEKTFYKIHLQTRNASRILLILKEFSAKTEKMLFDQAKRIDWDELFDIKQTYKVDGVQTSRGEGHFSSNTISKRVREAIEDVFQFRQGKIPAVDLKEPKVTVVAYVESGRCILSLDTSGKTLHKRGYKVDGHPAPLKETLAASVLELLKYDGSKDLFDPMCGSGTLAIEGAFIALNKAPLIHRAKGDFGFEWLKFFNKDLWRTVQDEVRSERKKDIDAKIFASDIEEKYVALAQSNALRARVEKYIQFKTQDFFAAMPPSPAGLMICNMPYGERLKEDSLKDFYQKIGDHLKRNFAGWKAAFLVHADSPYKFIGLKPARKIALLNGSIPVKLLVFDLYDGSKKTANCDK